MAYSNTTLVKLGREVLKKHPDIAVTLIEDLEPKRTDINQIENYFTVYCLSIGTNDIRPGKPHAEKKKVFIAAMINIFSNQYGFNRIISNVFGQTPNITTCMIKESECRYRIDHDFRVKVDNILNIIQ